MLIHNKLQQNQAEQQNVFTVKCTQLHIIIYFSRVQQETALKQKEEEEKQHQKALRHSDAIREQMREREFSALAKRREVFKEADQLIEEARQRRVRLDEIKEKKLKELK